MLFLLPLLAIGQIEADENVVVSQEQKDDVYLAGGTIKVNAAVQGDAVIAGGTIVIKDSISQDLVVAGGDITIKGYVGDDIRAAGGTLTIDTEVRDDVIIAGGEVTITDNAVIYGNLIAFSGNIETNGEVKGMAKVTGGELIMNGKIGKEAIIYGGDVVLNAEIMGTTTISAKDLEIGENAIFNGDVAYWCEDGKMDFGDSLNGAVATFDEDLAMEDRELPWKFLGVAAFGFWMFYVLSAFLAILLLQLFFKKQFANAVIEVDKNFLKSLGFGLIYLFGLPLLIGVMFMIIIGIPIGLFLTGFYLFSLLFGHLVAALLLAHYLNRKNEKTWNYWTLVFIALGIAIVFRLVTLLPFIGVVVSAFIIAIAYGLLAIILLKQNKPLIPV